MSLTLADWLVAVPLCIVLSFCVGTGVYVMFAAVKGAIESIGEAESTSSKVGAWSISVALISSVILILLLVLVPKFGTIAMEHTIPGEVYTVSLITVGVLFLLGIFIYMGCQLFDAVVSFIEECRNGTPTKELLSDGLRLAFCIVVFILPISFIIGICMEAVKL